MNKKLFIIFSLLFLLSMPFLSAEKLIQVSDPSIGLVIEYQKYDYLKIGEDFQLNIHVYNSTTGIEIDNSTTNCSIHAFYGNGSHAFASNLLFDEEDHDFYIDVPGVILTGGKTSVIIDCMDGVGGFVSIPVEVTLSGLPYHMESLWASIFLMFILFCFGFIIYKDREKLDDEKYWKTMVSKWKDKNYIRFSAVVIWYNMKKNAYVLYYLIGLLMMILTYDIIFNYNIRSMEPIFKILTTLYMWASVFVVMVLFGKVQEWLMDWKEEIENINWGGLAHGK